METEDRARARAVGGGRALVKGESPVLHNTKGLTKLTPTASGAYIIAAFSHWLPNYGTHPLKIFYYIRNYKLYLLRELDSQTKQVAS